MSLTNLEGDLQARLCQQQDYCCTWRLCHGQRGQVIIMVIGGALQPSVPAGLIAEIPGAQVSTVLIYEDQTELFWHQTASLRAICSVKAQATTGSLVRLYVWGRSETVRSAWTGQLECYGEQGKGGRNWFRMQLLNLGWLGRLLLILAVPPAISVFTSVLWFVCSVWRYWRALF